MALYRFSLRCCYNSQKARTSTHVHPHVRGETKCICSGILARSKEGGRSGTLFIVNLVSEVSQSQIRDGFPLVLFTNAGILKDKLKWSLGGGLKAGEMGAGMKWWQGFSVG